MTSTNKIAGLLLGATLCAQAGMAAAETLTVAVYGGIPGDAIGQCVLQPFAKENNVTVVPDPGSSAVTITKLIQQKQAPVIDVAWLDGGPSEQAWRAGLLDPLDPARIPNLNNLYDQARHSEQGRTYAATTGFFSFPLVYNTEMIREPPQSWKDLWSPKYKGMVALPSPKISMGIPLLVLLAQLYGGDADNIKPGLDKLKELNPTAYWDTSGSASNMFQSGEIGISPHFSTSAGPLIKGGLPLKMVVPKEGALAGDVRVHLVKGTPRKALAEKLIDYAITPKASLCLAEKMSAGPAVKGVTVPADVAPYMPWGANGSIKDLIIPDWLSLNDKREAYTNQWNAAISGH